MVYRCQGCGVELDGSMVVRQRLRVQTCTADMHTGPFAPILDSRGRPVTQTRPEVQPETQTAVEA